MIVKMKLIDIITSIVLIAVVVLFVILLSVPFIETQQEPTQQFNKIFLDPFYRISMDQDNPYTYTLEVNPPDRVSEVKSAIITFQMWLNPTIEFFLEVNGQTCNTPSYEVHTTYAGAGEGTIFFDCSNVIQEAGHYTIILTPDDDTGAITGWIDLTYMNQPKGEANVFGTEYRPTENGTVFLQLFDGAGSTINNASCEVTIYNPNKTKWYDEIDMDFLEDGLYYKDLFILNIPGVYMVSAFCHYDDIGALVHTEESVDYDGTLQGVSDNYAQVWFSDCAWMSTKGQWQEFNFTNPQIGNINTSLISRIDLNLIGTWDDNAILEMWNYDTSSWDDLTGYYVKTPDKDKCWGNQGITGTITSNFEDYINGDEMLARIYLSNGDKEIRTDEVSVHFHTTGGYIADIRGSGELHVNDWFNNYTGQMADAVWNYPNRTLTEFPIINATINSSEVADAVWQYNETINSNILNQITVDIWSYFNRTLTGFGDLVEQIWNYEPRNLTYYEDVTNYSLINETIQTRNDITDYDRINDSIQNRNDITDYDRINDSIQTRNDITDYGLIQKMVWNYTTRTLTNFNFSVDVNSSEIAETVWNYINRTLTDYNQSDLTDYDLIQKMVWNATVRTLTEFNFTVDANVSLEDIANEVWNYEPRNLTYYEDVTNYTFIGETVWQYNQTINSVILEAIGEFVWEYTNRTLTYYPVTNNISTEEIWNYQPRNLTFYEDVTDYDLIQEMVWNATTRTLTEFNFTVDVNTTAIAEEVWNYTMRTLTEYPNQTDLTDYDLIQDVVWNATVRTLTFYPVTNNISTEEIWNYEPRNLTYYPVVNLTNLTVNINNSAVAEAVWQYNGTINPNIINQFVVEFECSLNKLFAKEEGWGVDIQAC